MKTIPNSKPLAACKVIRGDKPTVKSLAEIKKIAKENKLIFVKIEPNALMDKKTVSLIKKAGGIAGKTLFTPTSFWIDLTKSEDELMKSFSTKTRYNIRLAQRKGVTVSQNNSATAFNRYLELTAETVRRQGFWAHSRRYHQLMWKYMHKAGIARLLTATYQGKVITTWIIFHQGDFIYYPYGASSHVNKNVMANNLMMWEAIKLGKKLKAKTFDLWGREVGKGFTKFKEGYNPKVVTFLGTWDIVVNPTLYFIYRIGEAIRWPVMRLSTKFIKPTF